MKYKNTRLEQYNIVDPILVFNTKLKNFSKEAKIVSYDPPPSIPWGLMITKLSSRRRGGGSGLLGALFQPLLQPLNKFVYFGNKS